MGRRHARGLREGLSDQRGIALVEFAFVLPFLILLYLGGVQLMDGIAAYRKVGLVVRTLADLTTQNTTMTSSQASEILDASQQVMAPYSNANGVMRISQVTVQLDGSGKVSWSRAKNGAALAVNSTVTLPATLRVLGTSYVFAEMTYNYTPPVTFFLVGQIPLQQTLYMSPRNSPTIVYTN